MTRSGSEDAALLQAFAERLERSSDNAAAELLADLIGRMRLEAVGTLMEQLPPAHVLDYAPHRIELVVSSSEIGLRLLSVENKPFTVEWIERSIRPGDVFYDIGANVVAYSLIAAKATGNRARIFAFEPSAASFHDLSRNVLLNRCEASVVPLPIALWAETDLLSFAADPPVPGAARHRIEPGAPAPEPGTLNVLGLGLDDLVERFGLPVPNHAKIDTDGYELEVLRGAERTLRRPEWYSLIVELDRAAPGKADEIARLLEEAGFDGGREHERRPSPNFPHPQGRPDVYATFAKADRQAPRGRRPLASTRPRPTRVQSVQRRAVTATLGAVTLLFLLLVFLPEQLGDRPYDVFGLRF